MSNANYILKGMGRAMGQGMAIGQMVQGKRQKEQGEELAAGLVRPETSTRAAQRAANINQKFLSRRAPTSEIDFNRARRQNIRDVEMAKNMSTNIGAYNNALNRADMSLQKGTTDVGKADMQSMYGGYRDTAQAYASLQDAKEQEYRNKQRYYKMDAAAASAMIGSGLENIYGGGYGVADNTYSMGEQV